METSQISNLAELALAAYGQFESDGPPSTDDLENLNGDVHGFSKVQADRFAARFNVAIKTFNDAISPLGSGNTSFDVTVFSGKTALNLNEIFIGFRGTGQKDPFSTPNDLESAVENYTAGLAASQIVQMYNWWQRVSTLNRADLPQYAIVSVPFGSPPLSNGLALPADGNKVELDYLVRIADAKSTGEVAALLSASPSSKVTVTGSSLGGHLSMAFSSLFPAITSEAVAFNSPGFRDNAYSRALFAGLGGSVPEIGSPLITNVVSTETNNAGARLDILAGFPDGNFPGRQLIVPIENQFNSDVLDPKVPSWNHDQRQMTDSLTVFNMLQQLDNTLTLARFGDFLRASASGENRSLENLVDVVESLVGINRDPLSAGNANRDQLHIAVQAIMGGAPQYPVQNANFQSLNAKFFLNPVDAGITALGRKDFGSFVVLKTLSPFVLKPVGASGQSALENLWQSSAWSAEYQDWVTDKALMLVGRPPSSISDKWLEDRGDLLVAALVRNRDNISGVVYPIPSQGIKAGHYFDVASSTDFTVGFDLPTTRQVWFGADAADNFEGRLGEDNLYGGAGDDTLDGKGGNDYLEGNAGNDNLMGGSGNDTLIGGTGQDTYQFNDAFGNDTVFDVDGLGKIKIGTSLLNGGTKVGDGIWESQDKKIVYVQRGADLIIGQRTTAGAATVSGTITLKRWQNGQLGLNLLDGPTTPAPVSPHIFVGDQHAPIVTDNQGAQTYNWAVTSWAADGTLAGGVAEPGFNDVIYGSSTGDTIYGLGGNDALDGSGGNDRIDGGAGDDVVAGGAGSDTIKGGSGDDLIFGATGLVAQQRGGPGGWSPTLENSVSPSSAQDDAPDDIDGGDGNDQITAGRGNDRVQGGAGDDLVWGLAGDDILEGGTGKDHLEGDGTIDAGYYSSTPANLHGSDFIDGGDGDDQIIGGGADDFLYGGAGDDELHGDGVGAGIPAQYEGNDYLEGEDGNDLLFGGGGDDVLLGGRGNDILNGGAGADYLDGGEGDDRYEAGAKDTITDSSGSNTVWLMDGAPWSVSTSGADLLLDYRSSGSLLIQGALRGSVVSIDGTPLGDWLQSYLTQGVRVVTTGAGQTLSGGGEGDRLIALHDAATLRGGAGNDVLSGGDGDDTLYGGSGDDVIDGGAGDDRLIAGKGQDTLRGGTGKDTYLLGYGTDKVTVVETAGDDAVLQLDGSGLTLQSLSARRRGEDLLVEVRGTSNSMLIEDYYGAAQANWMVRDAQGATLTAQQLIDVSGPQWSDLTGGLLQQFRSSARGQMEKRYIDTGYTQRADGGWFSTTPSNGAAPISNLFGNYLKETTTYTSYTHRLGANYGTVWTVDSNPVSTTYWNTSDWTQRGYSASDETIFITESAQTISAEFASIYQTSSYGFSYESVWADIAWSAAPTQYRTTVSPPRSYFYSPPGQPVELITEQTKRWDAETTYSGSVTSTTSQDPGAGAVTGPLPDYLRGNVLHHYREYDLTQATLSDGNHTIYADAYAAVLGGIGNNTIYGAGLAYGGVGNAVLADGGVLIAGSGDQMLKNGQTMVVGDGHDTVVGKAMRRSFIDVNRQLVEDQPDTLILVDPTNTGIDVIVSDGQTRHDTNSDGMDDVIASIYRKYGFTEGGFSIHSFLENYRHGGTYKFGNSYYTNLESARVAYELLHASAPWQDKLAAYIAPLPALLITPSHGFTTQGLGAPSDYYTEHPLETILLTGNNFAALRPYFEQGLLATKTVEFGPGLHLSDIALSWSQAISPVDGVARVTLDLGWGQDQGIRIMIPRADDVLNGTVAEFRFADGAVVALEALIAIAPAAPSFNPGYARLYAGMGQQNLVASNTAGLATESIDLAGLSMQADGSDLVISIKNSTDSLRLTGWYQNPYALPTTLLVLGDGSVLGANVLTVRGLVMDASAGGATVHGVSGFATTFIAGPNSTLLGASNADTYIYNAGSGVVHITDPGGGTLKFGSGITADMISLGLGSLMLRVGTSGGEIHIANFDGANSEDFDSVRSLQFADGTSLDMEQLLQRGFDLYGTAGNDTITGTDRADRFHVSPGSDTMQGGAGDDTYWIDNAGDQAIETPDAGVDTVVSSISLVLGANLENLTLGGTASINGSGNALSNRLVGNSADNTLNGGQGADTMVGGLGNDVYVVDALGDAVSELPGEGIDTVQSAVSYALGANLENLTLTGSAAIDGSGNTLGNILIGNAGSNTLMGDAAGETGDGEVVSGLQIVARGSALDGGWPVMEVWIEGVKVQSFVVGSSLWATYTVTAALGMRATNVDVVFVNDAYSPATNQDRNLMVNQIVVNGRAISASGAGAVLDYGVGAAALDGVNTSAGESMVSSNGALRIGLNGNDLLDGGAGADRLAGGHGNDRYVVDNAGDVVQELASAGHDIVRSSVSYTLSDNVEDLELTGTLSIDATGNTGRNTLRGNSGANRLDGGAGADWMGGAAGDDVYIVDNLADVIYEAAAGGNDTVESSVSFTLGAEVENLKLSGYGATDGTGNNLSNRLTGNAANNTLNGGAGNDLLEGGAGSDKLYGGEGDDGLTGDAAGEVAATELVTGLIVYARGTPCEGIWPTMEIWLAGVKVQSFTVNSAAWVAYAVTAASGVSASGVEIVFTNDAYRPDLGQDRNLFVDRIELNGRAIAASEAGTFLDYGSGIGSFDGVNTAVSAGVLPTNGAIRIGFGGNDLLDGGAGADRMQAGFGNDLYIVDHLGDTVTEAANAGHDTVRASVSYNLGDNLEDLELTGTLAINATGNGASNNLRGNAAANKLDGGSGADFMAGGDGDDLYIVDHVSDVVYELANAGIDSVQSSVSYSLGANIENLSLLGASDIHATGNALDNVLSGNAAANTLTGGLGNDTINGNAGSDRLFGGEGNDVLVGDAPSELAATELISSLVVFARGSVCEGGWPTMEVWLGGTKVQSFSVANADLVAYTVALPAGVVASSVDLVFTNDAYRPDIGQDRNLYVDRIEVNGRTVTTRDAGSVLDNGSGAGAFDGLNTTLFQGVAPSNGAIRIGLGGNDLLDGGSGADAMSGGFGNDVYWVDNTADAVTEAANAGHDIVRASADFTLGANVEDLELTGTFAINATGNAGNNTLRGNAGANRLDGGAGTDYLAGAEGSDTYVLGRGYGADMVFDFEAATGSIDQAAFGAGIAADQLWFRQVSSSLEVSVIGTADKMTIHNWYSGNAYHLEQFKTSDGKTLLDSQVQNLVSAMAAFAPPAMGQTNLSAAYASQLNTVIVSNWQ